MAVTWTTDTSYWGFSLLREVPLPALRAVAREFLHGRTGARLLHLQADDAENCFAVTFPTPPPDDTGLPHIMEHAVLGGSRKYPVREPFFEMAKISMATFINAMTSQAFTVYPICSNVRKDFFNLAEVYLDAVFHPEIRENTFRREGHHLALEDNADPASPLTISGIVYSEMKGAYSSPDAMMWRLCDRGLFPDTHLGRDSGGDPEAIPSLTYPQFVEFHRTHYHPANALIFVYGDIPTEEHLRFVAPVLDAFGPGGSRIAAPRQPRWTRPRDLTDAYPIGRDETTAAKTYITLNWIVGDATAPDHFVDLLVLYFLLLGDDAAPLKKAIIDSKLGADLFMAYADAHAYETVFHVGIKGSEPDRADAFQDLVLETLAAVARDGVTPDRVLAAYRNLAYEHLEVTSQYPLKLLWSVNHGWPYGADPLLFLRFDRHLAESQARYEADPKLFQALIRTGLLDNPHRLRVALRPSPDVQELRDAAFAAAMRERKAAFSEAEVARIGREAAALEAEQGVPNSAAALARLPQLQVGDLPPRPREIPTTVGRVAGMEVLRNDVFSNGVNYLDIAVDLTGLPAEWFALLPRLQDAFAKMGVEGQPYTRVAERRTAVTGGLGFSTWVTRHASEGDRVLRCLHLGLKTLDPQAEDAFELLGDLLFRLDPGDRERLRDVLTQAHAGYRSRFINDGMGVAQRRACRGLTPQGALDSILCSRQTMEQVDRLLKGFADEAPRLTETLTRMRGFLLDPARWTLSFTGSEAAFSALCRALESWRSSMRGSASAGPADYPFRRLCPPLREGLVGPYDVSYCVKAMPAPVQADPEAPLFGLGIYIARFDYFLPEIRFKGNAYGAGMSFHHGAGTFVLSSYRDPRLVETLQVFDGLRRFAEEASWSQTDIDRAIIGAAKGMVRPIRPEAANRGALFQHLRGETAALREAQYAASLRASPAGVREALLKQLDAGEALAAVCVASSRARLEAANRALGDRGLALDDVLPPE
ncbi:MAG: insulinase family protein [Lentisphaeria bacterium]|nr:insulinase family protein [Lentisphaeria bacterium]